MAVSNAELRKALNVINSPISGPNGVAKKLRKRNIRGTMSSPRFCPIANYLREQFPDELVHVDGRTAQVNGVTVRLNPSLRRFVNKFDSREFTELIG